MMRRLMRWTSLGGLASGLGLGLVACGSLLGIEEVHEGPPPGANAGSDSSAGDNGRGGNGGATNAGATTGGATHAGGANVAGAGNGGSAGAGHAGSAAGGADSAGAGPDAGAGGVLENSPVHGRVIDFWGHLLSQVPVQIAGKQAVTDAQGRFSVADVPAEYDASLVVQYVNDVTQTHAYSYQGLTRRDPTLQVFRGLNDSSANIEGTFQGADQSLTNDRTLSFALAGADGSFERMGSSSSGIGTSVSWVGPTSTVERGYGLIWQNDATSGLPLSYHAFATASLGLAAGSVDHVKFTLDLSPSSVASGILSGTVAPGNYASRQNSVSLRFTSGATIRLALETPTQSAFSYVVPNLPNSSVSFAAVDGCAGSTACAIVHKEGLVSGAPSFSVTIPAPPTQLTVSPAGAVNGNSTFSFVAAAAYTGPHVCILNNALGNDRLVIVTNQRSFKIPKLINGTYSLVAGATYTWTVQSHGSPADVDAMADASGFIDPYGFYTVNLEPTGLRQGDGTFTSSVRKSVTVAN